MSPPGHPLLTLATVLLAYLPTKVCMLSKCCREVARGCDAILTPHGAHRLARLVHAHGPALDPALPLRDGPPPMPDAVTGRYAYRTALYWKENGKEKGEGGSKTVGVFYECAGAGAMGNVTSSGKGTGKGRAQG